MLINRFPDIVDGAGKGDLELSTSIPSASAFLRSDMTEIAGLAPPLTFFARNSPQRSKLMKLSLRLASRPISATRQHV